MLLMIDNYDSFTYNLVQYFNELDCEVLVKRNDEITIHEINKLNPQYIVISPGPCTPNEAGISLELIQHFSSRIPILGVCLGHQCIAKVFGGDITYAKKVMHGKISIIHHDNSGIFNNLSPAFEATRYHSLVVGSDSLPNSFRITAWTENAGGDFDEIMGIAHQTLPLLGVQFHPESILTQQGHQLLKNFLKLH